MSNTKAIHDFVEHWRDTDSVEIDGFGHCKFPAEVEYTFKGRTTLHQTTVTILRNGFNEGKVSLDESGSLKATKYHLDFSKDFQEYSVREEDHAFVVSGDSPKMGGTYTAVLSPLVE
jgi:hypothetical protein